MKIIPAPDAVAREALTVVAGAVLAALIISQFPAVKRWIKQQWS